VSKPGRTIADRYELAAPLGEGGMGVVWRARDTRLGRAVAVKVLAADSLGSDVARKRLIREARAAAALEHEGIIRVYDVGETDDGGAFLVMELVRGQSVRDLLLKGPLSVKHAVDVIVQAGRALHVAHQAGIVHRDIKPDNIMVRESGVVIVVDFGIAKPVATDLIGSADTVPAASGANLTRAGQLVGTPAYLSPEQARGVEIDATTDQFALAVTAFEAMTGQLPWRGHGAVDVMAAILKDTPEPLTKLIPAPAAVESVLLRALSKSASDRYRDIGEFSNALEEAASALPSEAALRPSNRMVERPTRGKTPNDAESSSSALAETQAVAVTAPEVTRSGATAPPARRGVRTLAIALGLTALLASGGWYEMHRRMDRDPVAGSRAPTSAAFACPPFTVTGLAEPWLGVAAADLACDRLALTRGGLDARTLTTAELAGAPRELTKMAGNGLEKDVDRVGAVAAATAAEAWVDGSLEWSRAGYVVRIAIRDRDRVIRHGEGRGVELYEAIRGALNAEPAAASKEDLPSLREWLDVDSQEQAAALLDLQTAVLIEDPLSLKDECLAIAKRKDLSARVAYLASLTCAQKLRSGAPIGAAPAIDASTPGALITTSLAQGLSGGPTAVRERAGRLERMRDETALPEGKARLAAAAAELYNSVSDERAPSLARSSILASPKAIDWRTSAWHRLGFSSEGDTVLGAALMSWHSWEPVSQFLRVPRGNLADTALREKFVYRSSLLAQRGYYAYARGNELVGQGRLEEARAIADLGQDELLRVDILMGEARYGTVIEKVTRMVTELSASDETASLAFRAALDGAKASMTLGRPATFVDAVVTRWLDPEPPHVVDGVVPFLSLVTTCCLAPRPAGKRCVDRITKMRADGRLPGIFAAADTVLAGAARMVEDDYVGASKQWRTMLRTPGWVQDALRDTMAIAFDAAGEFDLAEEVDEPSLALATLPRTADMSWVRAARRAQKRGDQEKARRFAEVVVDKWRFAADDIPAVGEMKALLAHLPK
jgi:serine/threonine-protein kinase